MRLDRLMGILLMIGFTSCGQLCGDEPSQRTIAIDKAVRYLAKEVPAWIEDHNCISCHNQGEGGRGLLLARKLNLLDDDSVLKRSLEWIEQPERWNTNRNQTESRNLQLATLQFADTLIAAYPNDPHRFKTGIDRIAEFLANDPSKDGAWRTDSDSDFASPVTQGPILLTGVGIRTLRLSNPIRFSARIATAEKWLAAQLPRSTFEAASILIASESIQNPNASLQQECVAKILASIDTEGGWGPHSNAAPENFDTALVVISLTKVSRTEEITQAVEKGIAYLLSSQEDSGAWTETTRPPGTESYAHRISTTGWALQALLEMQAFTAHNKH